MLVAERQVTGSSRLQIGSRKESVAGAGLTDKSGSAEAEGSDGEGSEADDREGSW